MGLLFMMAGRNEAVPTRRAVLSLLAGSVVASTTASGASGPRPTFYPGVNLAGGEFGNGLRHGTNYIYPSREQIQYYASRGFRLIRVPIAPYRLLGDDPGIQNGIMVLRSAVEAAAQLNVTVVIDLHEYGYKADRTLWSNSAADLAAFQEMWRSLASLFAQYPNVWFGIMNEPNKQAPDVWFDLANAGIRGVRQVAVNNKIAVMGSRWGTADGWLQSGNARASSRLVDPSNNLVIEVHQYLDNAGGKPERAKAVAGKGASALVEITRWAREKRQTLFLGEFGVTDAPEYLEEGRELLRHVYANQDVWIGYAYWAGGLWWAEGKSTYGFSLEPRSLAAPVDRPQMLMLREFMPGSK